MCRHDNQDHESGTYYVSRKVVREESARYNPIVRGNYFGEYPNA